MIGFGVELVYLLGRLLNGDRSILDGSDHVSGGLVVNSATDSGAGTEDLQNSSGESLGERTGAHDLGNSDNVVEGDVSVVLNVLLLLAVTVGLVEGLDDQRGGSGDELDGSLTVLDDQLDGDADSLPFLSSLGDIISNLLGGQTEGTNLGGKSGGGGGFTSDDTDGDYCPGKSSISTHHIDEKDKIETKGMLARSSPQLVEWLIHLSFKQSTDTYVRPSRWDQP